MLISKLKFRNLIYLELVIVLTINWLTTNPNFLEYGPSYLGLIPKSSILLIEVIGILIFMYVVYRKNTLPKDLIIFLLVLYIFLFFNFASFFAEQGTLINLSIGLRNYLGFIPLFFAGLYLRYKKYSLRPFLILLLGIMIIQIPIALVQFLIAMQFEDVIRVGGTLYDVVSGTMGGIAGNLLSVLFASAISLMLPFLLRGQRRVLFTLLTISFLVVMALAEAKGGFLLVIITGFYFFITSNLNVKKKISFLLGGVSVVLVFILVYSSFIEFDRQPWNPKYLIEYEESKENRIGGRLSRLDAITYSLEEISDNPFRLLFGVGIGNATRNSAPIGIDGKYYDFNTDINYWNRLLLETGLMGLLVNSLIIFYLFNMALILKRRSRSTFISTIAYGFTGCLLIYVFAGLYDDSPIRFQYLYPFSLISGYLYYEFRKIT